MKFKTGESGPESAVIMVTETVQDLAKDKNCEEHDEEKSDKCEKQCDLYKQIIKSLELNLEIAKRALDLSKQTVNNLVELLHEDDD